jgi:hypothetical protein
MRIVALCDVALDRALLSGAQGSISDISALDSGKFAAGAGD